MENIGIHSGKRLFNADLNKQAQKIIFSWKMTKHFIQKFGSTIEIYLNKKLIWIRNWISIIIFSRKFPNQCNKLMSHYITPHRHYDDVVYVKKRNEALKLYNGLQNCFCFLKLENLVYQYNPFIINNNTTQSTF